MTRNFDYNDLGGVLSDSEILIINKGNPQQPVAPFSPVRTRMDAPAAKPDNNTTLPQTGTRNSLPSSGLSAASYDLRLGNEFVFFADSNAESKDGKFSFKELDVDLAQLDQVHYRRVTSDVIWLAPGQFMLTSAMELINLPFDIGASVKDKSTLARLGVFVQNTWIDPGFGNPKGASLVLEITNNSPNRVKLYAGMGICQLVFHRIIGEVKKPYDSKYQGQIGVQVAK